jgi:hypothetical protein
MKRIIVSLVCLNIGLAAFLTYACLNSSRKQSQGSGGEIVAATAPQASGAAKVKPASRPAIRLSNGKFDWQSLFTPDLRQYAANLRAVECPEETIRDILMAEINRQYAPREAELKVRPEDRFPWESVTSYDKRAKESKFRQLLVEKRDLLKELVGVDVPIETPPTLAGRNIEKFEAAYRDLPEAKREQVRAIQEKYWGQSDEIKRRTMGFLEPEDRELYKQIKSERRQEMAQILSAQELEDYELKTSPTGSALRSRLSGFDATEEEMRQIFRLTQPLDEEYSLISGTRDPEDKVAAAKRKEVEQQWQEQLHGLLGDERFAEMERSKDQAYQHMVRAGQEAGVPKDSIVQAYEAQKVMREEASRVMKDPSLSPEQRQQALLGMQAEGEKALQSILGEQAFEALRRNNPNLAPPGGDVIRRVQNFVRQPIGP